MLHYKKYTSKPTCIKKTYFQPTFMVKNLKSNVQ
jgi:hypothetical protein